MRVAVLGHTYIVRANRGKYRALERRGHQVLLCSPRLWRETDFGLRTFEHDDRLDTAAFSCPFHGRVRRYWYPRGELLAALRGWRPDALVAETEPGGLAALEAVWAATCLGLPLLPFAWENLPLTGWSRLAALPVYRAARRLLVGSGGAALVARRAGYRGPLTVIPQVGVDPARIPPRRDAGPATPPTVLFLGRLDRKKGADLLLDALAAAPAWRGLIIGDGAERGNLEAHAARLRLNDRVTFRAAVSHEEVPAVLTGADALALPSRTVPGWAEQFGHVLAWAMAAGLPIVASRCGAIPEVVGDAGLLCAENAAPELAAALGRLTDGATWRQLAENGRRRAAARFTDEAVAARLEQALRLAWERNDADFGL